MKSTSRRDFLRGSMYVGLALSTATTGQVFHGGDHQKDGALLLHTLRIDGNGVVTLIHTTTDIGQGTPSVLAQIVADQLDVDWSNMQPEQAPVCPPYATDANYYATSSSSGVAAQFDELQKIGATARALLLTAAARRWRVPASECTSSNGRVFHSRSSRELAYGALANAAAALPVPKHVKMRAPFAGQLVGTSPRAINADAKVTGDYRYGIDVQQPDLRVASIVQCPIQGGRLSTVDCTPATTSRGVSAVVLLENAVAVVADTYWNAQLAINKLEPKWSFPVLPLASQAISQNLRNACHAGQGRWVSLGKATANALGQSRRLSVQKNLGDSAIKFDVYYESHIAAHVTMEPQNATALMVDGQAKIWLPTQNQALVQQAVAAELGISLARVEVITTGVGGGFGRRLEPDVALQAVRIARKVGGPVKLIWSREEDIRHDYFRPPSAARIRAAIDDEGRFTELMLDLAGSSILASSASTHPLGADGIDFTSLMALKTPYSLPTPIASWTQVESGVKSGWWRSVGAAQNCFFLESFIDEIAHRLRVNPVDYRKRLLARDRRALSVLERLANVAKLGQPLEAGRAHGIAMTFLSDSIAATAIELSLDDQKNITIHRIDCVFDCGFAVNPARVEAQVSGAIVWGLSSCLLGEITVHDGRVVQSNFHDYPVLRMSQTPPIHVHLLNGGTKPGGAGEEAVPTVAPAIANGVFAASGMRLRETPFSRAGVQLAAR